MGKWLNAVLLTPVLVASVVALVGVAFMPRHLTAEVSDGVGAVDRFGVPEANVYVFKNGKLVSEAHNIITNVGVAFIRNDIHAGNSSASDKARYLALSTDSTAVAYTDTTCPSEITTGGLARANATVTTQSGPSSGDITVRIEYTFTATAAHTGVQKACLFTQSSGGTLYAIATFSAVNLATNDQLTIRWDFSYNN